MFSNLLSRIRTTEEKDKLLQEVELLLQSLYEQRGVGFDSTLTAKVRAWVAEVIRREINKAGSREDYLEKLKDILVSLKKLTLTLGFEPTDKSLDKFASFVLKKKGEGIVLEIIYDPKIIAGAIIVYEGNYRDFSLKKVFEREINAKENELMQILNQPS